MKILVVSFSDLSRDPRVSRQIDALASAHEVIAAGLVAPTTSVRFVRIPSPNNPVPLRLLLMGLMRLGLHEAAYWLDPAIRGAREALADVAFDCIVANEVHALPLCLSIAGVRPVVLDAHEYSPLEFEDKWWWRISYGHFYNYICRKYLRRTACMMTVCDGIADEYARVYGVRRPTVVFNAPYYRDITPAKTVPGRVRLVHHGAAIPSRGLEKMIDAVRLLGSEYSLDLLLMANNRRYLEFLRQRARDLERVRFLDPVPMQELPEILANYDVGIYLLEPSSFNNRLALPNKFFEFIQARLAIVVGPSMEMANKIRHFDCGLIASDFSPQAFAEQLQCLTPPTIDRMRANSCVAAKELSFETSAEAVRNLVMDALAATSKSG
jgi:glycosyltransferase involved in cell wall biosynthesis